MSKWHTRNENSLAMILEGDVLECLAGIKDNSVDAVLSDPPYGISFMGKQWDKGVPSKRVWEETLRVLKPGGHMLTFGGTRTYHRQVVNIEDAGFEIRDCLMWLYGSGFPKSHNVSKAIDAEAGAVREVVGKSSRHNSYSTGTGATLGHAIGVPDITAPATPLAQAWDGYGTALKPGWEPITLARKPLEGTVAANVAKWGVGGLSIDACRIGNGIVGWGGGPAGGASWNENNMGLGKPGDPRPVEGRWPANVILDEEAGMALDAQTGELKSGGGDKTLKTGNSMFFRAKESRSPTCHSPDSGGASRFFYCAKVSRSEREAGCGDLPHRSAGEATDREDDSAGLNSPRAGASRGGGARNHHPTLKPLALTTYLARLLLPPTPGRILVPYSGAGSEMLGCLAAGWPGVLGIELSPEYNEIARARITHRMGTPPKAA